MRTVYRAKVFTVSNGEKTFEAVNVIDVTQNTHLSQDDAVSLLYGECTVDGYKVVHITEVDMTGGNFGFNKYRRQPIKRKAEDRAV